MNVKRLVFKAVAGFTFLGAGLATAEASAQQVRILADGTAVRLDPSDSSPVITTLQSGTLLDWIGESGAYHTVSLPSQPGQENLVGYVLASQVELVGALLPPTTGLPTGSQPTATMTIPDLQRQYENERERRSSGRRKVIWGLVLIGAAYTALEYVPPLQLPDPEDYEDAESYQSALDRRSAAETGRTVTTGLGAALGTWGLGQFIFGWRNMRDLELELPRSAAPSLQQQYAEATESRSSGRRKAFWGFFLAAASYATVEWVPYFGVPAAEDFENAEDYQAAVDRRDKAETARLWATGAGAGLGVWGATRWVLAARKMTEIEATARMSALSVPVVAPGGRVATDLFVSRVGDRIRFGVNWRW